MKQRSSPLLVLLTAAVAFGCAVRAQAGELATTLLGPSQPVEGGANVVVWLNVLNTSLAEARWPFTKELPGRLRTGEREIGVVLNLAHPSEAGDALIGPQGFVRREYSLRLPSEVEGRALLEVEGFPGSAVPLEIRHAVETAPITETSQALGPSRVSADATSDTSDPESYFKRHFFPYEPFYFIAGPDSPNAKFQISFKYQLVDDRSQMAQKAGFVTNLFIGFTQTSLWDLNTPSAPFEDSSYKPDLMFSRVGLFRNRAEWFRLDLQTGGQHESNGRDGADSRSLNIAYVRPTLIFGHDDGWQFTFAPRAWVYLPDLTDNPDLPRYRGHFDVRAVIGKSDSVQLAAYARAGDDFDRESLQLDLTYPLKRFGWAGLTWCLQAQYFTGYGESLLHYNERSTAYRFGFSIFR